MDFFYGRDGLVVSFFSKSGLFYDGDAYDLERRNGHGRNKPPLALPSNQPQTLSGRSVSKVNRLTYDDISMRTPSKRLRSVQDSDVQDSNGLRDPVVEEVCLNTRTRALYLSPSIFQSQLSVCLCFLTLPLLPLPSLIGLSQHTTVRAASQLQQKKGKEGGRLCQASKKSDGV